MKLRYNKALLSLATAVLMITSVLTILGSSAAGANEITLRADKLTIKNGDRINVTVGFVPDRSGAAGFTLDLHYDPNKVEVHIPDNNEASTLYNVGSRFSVITNYEYASGVIRIVGANLDSTNIQTATALSLAAFDVKEGASGEIAFYTEVEVLVSASDGGYVNAPYSCESISVSIAEEPKPTQTTTVTTAKPAATTTSETTTTTATTTAAPTTTTTTTTAATTPPPTTTTTMAATAVPTTTTTTTAATTAPPPVTTTASTTVPAPVTTTAASPEPAPGQSKDALFSYHCGSIDFNSEENISYSIPLRDYISDRSKHYDVRIAVQASGNANAGIGLISDGEYRRQDEKLRTQAEQVWTLSGIDPSRMTSDIVITLYYLKAGSEFRVNSVEFIELADQPSELPIVPPADEELPDDDSDDTAADEQPQETEPAEPTPDESNGTDDELQNGSDTGTADDTDAPSEDTDDTASGDVIGGEQNAETAQPPEIEGDSGDEPQTDIGEDLSDKNAAPENSAAEGRDELPEADRIENAVIHASQVAGDPDASQNLQTGSSHGAVKGTVMVLCGMYMIWSLFAVVFNKVSDSRRRR